MSEAELRERLVKVARRLDSKGILTAIDGNISIRLDGDALLITPSGACKGLLEPEDLVVVGPNDRVKGGGRPSGEIPLHRAIYRLRADVGAVVHAHPSYATAYAVAGIALDRPILSEAVVYIGAVHVAPYAAPASAALADSVAPFVGDGSAILMRHHGAITFADTIERAGFLMETLEHVATIDFRARMLGSEAVLPSADVEELRLLRAAMAGSTR